MLPRYPKIYTCSWETLVMVMLLWIICYARPVMCTELFSHHQCWLELDILQFRSQFFPCWNIHVHGFDVAYWHCNWSLRILAMVLHNILKRDHAYLVVVFLSIIVGDFTRKVHDPHLKRNLSAAIGFLIGVLFCGWEMCHLVISTCVGTVIMKTLKSG